MLYSRLVDVYEELEKTPARLKKVGIISGILKGSENEILPKVTLLVQGKLFPSWSEKEIGIANLLMVKIISTATGFSEKEVMGGFKKTGDFGLVAENLMGRKRQKTLFTKKLTVNRVFENLRALADIEGKGSQERKFQLVSELINSASPREARYIVRTTLGNMRLGVAEGIVRDSIARAFLEREDPKEAVGAVEWAWFLRPDYGEVAILAKTKGMKGLKEVKLEVGKPYHVMLSERAKSLEDAMNTFERIILEYKYDGARISIHKDGDGIKLFTRRMEEVTKQFPELVKLARECITARECIVEGEILSVNPKTGKPMPFQFLSQRIKRKYDIGRVSKEIPVQVNVFDLVYLNGRSLFMETLDKRRKELTVLIKERKDKFQVAKSLITKDINRAEGFYKESLRNNQEGLMVKNLDARYQPGRRVGYWLKVKPTMENLDLAIIGGTWGTGKRTGWLGSLILGCRDSKTGEFLECGMIGTGVKEKEGSVGVTFKQLTELLKPYIESEKGNEVRIKPKVVVEVAYEEIQKSPNYKSGFALRFPRVLQIRIDKDISESDTVEKIARLFEQQGGRG